MAPTREDGIRFAKRSSLWSYYTIISSVNCLRICLYGSLPPNNMDSFQNITGVWCAQPEDNSNCDDEEDYSER